MSQGQELSSLLQTLDVISAQINSSTLARCPGVTVGFRYLAEVIVRLLGRVFPL